MGHLDDALRLERDLLDGVRRMIAELPAGNAYRLLLERHQEELEAAIERIQQLGGRPEEEDAQAG